MSPWLSTLLGVVAALAGTWLQAELQRRRTHDDRMWARKADLYIELLHKRSGGAGAWGAQMRELGARVDAFASTRVRGFYEESLLTHEQLNFYVDENDFANPPDRPDMWPEPDDELRQFMHDRDEADKRLRDQVREELGTDRPRNLANWLIRLRLRWHRLRPLPVRPPLD